MQGDDIPSEHHALVPSFMGGGVGKKILPLPFSDFTPVQTRSMDPFKDSSAYGYGSVAWKERVETWRQKQERLIKNEDGDKDWGNDGDGIDLPVARQYGWPNTYVFTKAMGEMLIGQLRGDLPVSIIRPYVITSTIREPFPGWIEVISHINKLAIGYGKGKIPYFVGDPELVIDLVST
ncbi:hypothetical protein GIB67_038395 [Kingdonia uniflora]|uniref:Fatty acyl-CoA reductase n=1 Tax=Kingdonia uniflora TaxID=39325 RepID=A0A7J7NPP1_9MAGN|nr:hypothetical protein GIB67_038395 [Kingdonia uniflora]